MKNSFKIAFALVAISFAFSSLSNAGISIDTAYPNVGQVGEDLSIIIRGSGFDEQTRITFSPDEGNRSQIIGSVETPDFAIGVAVQDQNAYVASARGGLIVMDVSDPTNPAIVGSVDTPGSARRVAVQDRLAFVADEYGGLQIIDVSDPVSPAIVGTVNTPGFAESVAVQDQIAYVAELGNRLQVVDVSEPANPVIIGSVFIPGFAWSVTVQDQTAYLVCWAESLQIIDVSDPQNPAIVGSVNIPACAESVAVQGQTAYVASGGAGLQIIDVSDPINPGIVGSVETSGWADYVFVQGQTAYVADGRAGLQVIDVSDPLNPAVAWRVDTSGNADSVFVAQDQIAYVADGEGGLQVIDVRDPTNTFPSGSLDTPGFARGVAVQGQTAYVADKSGGLQIFDVSDPLNLAIVGSVDTPGSAYCVAVLNQTAYVADESAGLQVVDVSDPQNPAIVGSVDTPGAAYDVAVQDQTAYVADGGKCLQVIDVSDPMNPAIVGSVDFPGTARSVCVQLQAAYVGDGSRLWVIDVSDPVNPTVAGMVDTNGFAEEVAVHGQTAYVAGHFSGGRASMQVVDVSNPQNPIIQGSVDTTGEALGVFIVEHTAYVADFDVVQVIDVSDPNNPVIIGKIHTPGYAKDVVVNGSMAYVADSISGLTIAPIPKEVAPVQLIGPSELRVTLPGQSYSGHYNIGVFNQTESDDLIGAVSFLNPEAYQAQLEKKAIIAAGGTGDSSDRLFIPTQNCSNYAYKCLLTQGYARENIQFLAPHLDCDVDGDGVLNDVDDECSTATLSSAITYWASGASELVVFLVDHGGIGTFYANAGDIVHASDLDAWLDIAQDTIPGKAVLIYDACYSGSFLDYMDPPPGKDRIVVASSRADESAWFLNDGKLSFSYQFWASVYYNPDLRLSFIDAKKMMSPENTDRPPQTAVLDADGDGVSGKEDLELAKGFVIGRGWVGASIPPEIGEVSEEQVLSGTSSANLWASNITALNEIERVWAVVVPPDFDHAADDEVTDLDTVELTDPDQDGVYAGVYYRLFQTGTYDIFVYASDVLESFSLPVATTVVVVDTDVEVPLYIDSSGSCGVGREPCYDTIQQGLSETGQAAFRIEIAQGDYPEDLTVANDCRYTLSGGYDIDYAIQNGLSVIIGSLTISKGTLEVENLVIAGP